MTKQVLFKTVLHWLLLISCTAFLLALNNIAYAQSNQRTVPVLSPSIEPLSQSITFHLDLDKTAYSGTTELNLIVREPITKIPVLFAGLNVSSAIMTRSGAKTPLRIKTLNNSRHELTSDNLIAKGNYQLLVTFEGKLSDSELGLNSYSYKQHSFIYSNFQNQGAQFAFPVFELGKKLLSYQLTVNAPESLRVISNTSSQINNKRGKRKEHVFKQTRPILSEQLSLVVGQFEQLEVKGTAKPISLYTLSANKNTKVPDMQYAAKHISGILTELAQYFDLTMPFEKLEIVALPQELVSSTVSPGLVLMSESALLTSRHKLLNNKPVVVSSLANQLSQLWFGSYISLESQKHSALRAALSAMFEHKVMTQLYPHLAWHLLKDSDYFQRSLNQPAPEQPRLQLMLMIEQLIGEQTFKLAIQQYLKKNSRQVFDQNTFWLMVSRMAKQDVASIVKSYKLSSASPLLVVPDNGNLFVQILDEQQPETQAEERIEQQANWLIPLKLKYSQAQKQRYQDVIIGKDQLLFPQAKHADWILPTANGIGDFYWHLESQMHYQQLLQDIGKLSPQEQVAVLNNSHQLFIAEYVSLEQHLSLITALLKQHDLAVFIKALDELNVLANYWVNDDNQAIFFNAFSFLINDKLMALGLKQTNWDSELTILTRASLLRFAAKYSADSMFIESAKLQFEQAVEKGYKGTVYKLASAIIALVNNEQQTVTIDSLLALYQRTDNSAVKASIIQSMKLLSNQQVERILTLLGKKSFNKSDKLNLIEALLTSQRNQQLVINWLEQNLGVFSALSVSSLCAEFEGKLKGKLAMTISELKERAEYCDMQVQRFQIDFDHAISLM